MTTSTTIEVVAEMTEAEARALTDRARESLYTAWDVLIETHDSGAWRVLKYGSWREYAAAEFAVSQVQAYYLLNQGRVVRAIESAAGSSDFNMLKKITIRTATDIRTHIDDIAEEVRERVDAGEEPEAVVDAVVAKYRTPTAKPGTRVYKGKPQEEILGNVMSTLRATAHTVATLEMSQFTDDAPAVAWVKEIDTTVRELRALRARLRERYDIS